MHEDNTKRAREILRTDGWPAISQVCEDGSEAMWLIVQHSVLDPELMLSCVPGLESLVEKNEAKGWQLAFLQDRALMLQGKPQIFGAQHLLNGDGELHPYKLENLEEVDERRKAVGLEPLEDRTRLPQADREKARNSDSKKREHLLRMAYPCWVGGTVPPAMLVL